MDPNIVNSTSIADVGSGGVWIRNTEYWKKKVQQVCNAQDFSSYFGMIIT